MKKLYSLPKLLMKMATPAKISLTCKLNQLPAHRELPDKQIEFFLNDGGDRIFTVRVKPKMFKKLTDHGFDALGAGRVWLDASGENVRAQRIYDRAGYRLEGRQRAHWWRPALGRAVDLMLYGMMRDEWRP